VTTSISSFLLIQLETSLFAVSLARLAFALFSLAAHIPQDTLRLPTNDFSFFCVVSDRQTKRG
jgi:hypothetical protein